MAWPDTSLPIEVKLELSADLTADPTGYTFATDITSYTFDRDGNSSIVIQRGRQDEMSQSQPSSCTLTANNRDGRFSPRNPVGAYYPGLRRNTPIRVRVNPGSGLTTRYVGFVSEWPPRWDPAEKDHNVPVRADGVLRRLQQGASPLKSALFRAMTAVSAVAPVHYWPLEDGSDASQASNVVTGGPSLALVDPAILGAGGVTGAASCVDFTPGGQLLGTLPPVATSDFTISLAASWAGTNSSTLVQLSGVGFPQLRIYTDAGVLKIDGPDTGTLTGTAVNDGLSHHIAFTLHDTGGGQSSLKFRIDGVEVATAIVFADLTSSPTSITFNLPATADANGPRVAHVALYNSINNTDLGSAARGYAGEVSGTRFARLCAEESIQTNVAAGSTEAMGPQSVKTLPDLLRECEAAEEGLIVERVDGRLGFDPHSVRENQTVALTLDYAARHVSPPLEPTDDDQRIRNDVTVIRAGGSKSTVVDQDGPVGITAVGRYDEGVELNLYTDSQPYNHAGWRVNLGTVDGLRFPTVTVNLRRNNSLTASFLALDIGDRIKITNLPDIISYDDADLIVEGYTEQISQKNWVITFNCAPYRPWKAFTLANTSGDTGEFLGRLAPDSMDLLVARDTTQTSWTVATVPKFTVDSDDYPMTLKVAGERVTATAVSAVTASFVAAGTAAHADNASVTPGLPAGLQAGDLILVLAAIRNTSFTAATPSGYHSICDNTNQRLFAKIASGSEAAPTVTFTGGAAGDTCSAQACAFRGVGGALLLSRTQANGSAQDIAVPPLAVHDIVDTLGNLVRDAVLVYIGWKQDDWTSVAPVTSFTEIGEPSSTLGNDQGITWDYQLPGAPTTASGSFVVTGGAAAISFSGVVVLRSDVVTLTVTRSVNGVVKSQALDADIEIDEPMVLAL